MISIRPASTNQDPALSQQIMSWPGWSRLFQKIVISLSRIFIGPVYKNVRTWKCHKVTISNKLSVFECQKVLTFHWSSKCQNLQLDKISENFWKPSEFHFSDIFVFWVPEIFWKLKILKIIGLISLVMSHKNDSFLWWR